MTDRHDIQSSADNFASANLFVNNTGDIRPANDQLADDVSDDEGTHWWVRSKTSGNLVSH